MKKRNKILAGVGTIAAVVAPLAGVVSCGSSSGSEITSALKKYDRNEVIIKSTWAANDAKFGALVTLAEEYNRTQKGVAGFKPVRVVHFEGGYGSILPTEIKEIKNGYLKNVPNLLFDYPDVLGQLSAYGWTLDFNKYGLKRELFEKAFTDVNSQIGGLNTNGFYAVPMSKSTDMMTINIPVMAQIVDQMTKAGAKFNGTTSDAATKINHTLIEMKKANTNEQKELVEVKKKWPNITGKKLTKTYDLDKLFSSYDHLLDFVGDAQEFFFGSGGKDKHFHVMGVDAGTNLVYTMSYALAKNDMSKFLFSKNGENVKYSFKDSGTDQAKLLKTTFDMLEKPMNNSGIVINGAGSFTSTEFVKHGYAISLGSTAGYTHNYAKGGVAYFERKSGSKKGNLSIRESYDYLTKPKAGDAKEHVIARIGSHHNKVYDSTYTGKVGGYEHKITEAAAISAIKAAAAKATSEHDKFGYLVRDTHDSDADRIIGGIKAYYEKDGKYDGQYMYSPAKNVKIFSPTETLQWGEASFRTAPLKVHEADKNAVLMGQGPSMIGIGMSEAMNIATVDFVKWFSDTKNKFKPKDKDGNVLPEISIPEYFAKTTEYIVPYKGAFDGTTSLKNGSRIAFNAFKDIIKKTGEAKGMTKSDIFENPIDLFSGRIRKNVFDVTLKDEWAGFVHSTAARSAQDIYNLLSGKAKAELR